MTKNLNSIGGQHLIFLLRNEEYGIPLAQVREILGPEDIQSSEQNATCVSGMIKVHNQMIPILDLYCRFGLKSTPTKGGGAVLVTSFGPHGVMVGLMVDSIREVLPVKGDLLEKSSIPKGDPRSDFVIGLVKTEDRAIYLLNLEKDGDLLPSFSPV